MFDDLLHSLKVKHGAAKMRADERAILSEVKFVGAAMIMILVVALVLTELWSAIPWETDADGNYTGPFGDVVSSLETTGAAALTLLVVGVLVVAATAIMDTFGGTGR